MNEDLNFSKAQTGRAVEDVALQIEAAILSGKILPGESLPSERVLQTRFGTGRGVIREALGTLKQKGLIEIRKGAKGGAYVKTIDIINASESLALFLKQHSVDAENLIEFRESIDRTITILAISRGTTEEKNAIHEEALAFEAMLTQETPDMELIAEKDRELNVKLARMTKNSLFEWLMQAMQLGYSSSDINLYESSGYREKTITNWSNTTGAIKADEPLMALSYIGYHYALLRQRVRELKKRKIV